MSDVLEMNELGLDITPPDVFATVISQARPGMLRLTFRLTRDRTYAEEAVQNAILRAWVRRETFRRECAPILWLLPIARNEALCVLRQEKKFSALDSEEEEKILDARPNQHDMLASKEMSAIIWGAIDGLPPLYRKALHHRHTELPKEKEADDINTRVRVCRAHEKLRNDRDLLNMQCGSSEVVRSFSAVETPDMLQGRGPVRPPLKPLVRKLTA